MLNRLIPCLPPGKIVQALILQLRDLMGLSGMLPCNYSPQILLSDSAFSKVIKDNELLRNEHPILVFTMDVPY